MWAKREKKGVEKYTVWRGPILKDFVQMLKNFPFIEGNGNSLEKAEYVKGMVRLRSGKITPKAMWKVQVA